MAKISTGSSNQAENSVNQAVESAVSGAIDSISGVNNILGGIVPRSSSEDNGGSGIASDSGGYGLPVNTESGPVYDPNPDKRMANDRGSPRMPGKNRVYALLLLLLLLQRRKLSGLLLYRKTHPSPYQLI